ncbi:MAG: Nif3-like dinuclear metal center hexameric protein [Firmicutes bacterium]|nr:Nif3-like dinuclear metal center hexameric protein [Bacillota bacterium]
MKLFELTGYLDDYLMVPHIPDSSLNGLQIETDREITKIATAVDATIETFKRANENNAELIIVHHGLFWGKAPIRGPLYRRVRYLIENRLSLYAAHLPLDMHEEVGNNAELAKILGIRNIQPFLRYKGSLIGLFGEIDAIDIHGITELLEDQLRSDIKVFPLGKHKITKVAICSGDGGQDLDQAIEKGADLYLTGETSHEALTLAKDAGINLIFAGHYSTETLGPKALGKHIETKFGLPTVFIDVPTGL